VEHKLRYESFINIAGCNLFRRLFKDAVNVDDWDSSVGIAMGYMLDGLGIEVRFPARARDLSLLHSFQTGSGVQPAPYLKGNGGSFSWIKVAGG
jgi:hypothetical protein